MMNGSIMASLIKERDNRTVPKSVPVLICTENNTYWFAYIPDSRKNKFHGSSIWKWYCYNWWDISWKSTVSTHDFYTQNQQFHSKWLGRLSNLIIHFSIPTEILSIAGKYDPNFKYKTTATNLVLPDSMFVNGVAIHLENTTDCSTITKIGTMNSNIIF